MNEQEVILLGYENVKDAKSTLLGSSSEAVLRKVFFEEYFSRNILRETVLRGILFELLDRIKKTTKKTSLL